MEEMVNVHRAEGILFGRLRRCELDYGGHVLDNDHK